MAPIEIPFLIVGAGPVGLAAAQLLAAQGRECLVVERREGPLRHPAAHAVNGRTLEIFRQSGFDMDAIHAVAADPADAGHVNFVTRLAGELIGRLPYERQGDECLDFTPTPLRNIAQHRLEPILSEGVRSNGVSRLQYSTEWERSEQDADGVTSVIRDLETGESFEVRSRFLLGADGAASRVRRSLGIEMVGPASLQSFIAIHFEADLRSLVATRPGVLHFVMDSDVAGTFVAHDIDREWVFMLGFDPETESADDYDPTRCERITRSAIGDTETEVPIDVLSAGSWNMSAQVAERMRDRRIFLIGDAAHRFPPTGGMGLNTGVADAHGLVWKLCAVEDGWAGEAILDTHESERHPVAELNCEQSTTNAFKMFGLVEALGAGASPSAIDAAVQEQATHFDMIGLQLGYCYAQGALVRDGDPPPPITDPSVFEPDGAVGTRLPHAWTDDGRSTLDLVDTAVLTLVSMGSHDAWASTAASLPVPVRHVRIGPDAVVDERWRQRCGLGADAAMLVRPDQHIAWRATSVEDAATLPAAVAEILRR